LQLDCIWPVYQSVESGVYSCFLFQHHLYLRVAHSQWTEVKRRREGGIANTNTRTSSPMILERKLAHVHQWKEIATWNLDVYRELDCSACRVSAKFSSRRIENSQVYTSYVSLQLYWVPSGISTLYGKATVCVATMPHDQHPSTPKSVQGGNVK
jgi:hypothetical protein